MMMCVGINDLWREMLSCEGRNSQSVTALCGTDSVVWCVKWEYCISMEEGSNTKSNPKWPANTTHRNTRQCNHYTRFLIPGWLCLSVPLPPPPQTTTTHHNHTPPLCQPNSHAVYLQYIGLEIITSSRYSSTVVFSQANGKFPKPMNTCWIWLDDKGFLVQSRWSIMLLGLDIYVYSRPSMNY